MDATGTRVTPMRVFIQARTVIAAAGALHTPALLLRSGVKGRGHVGRHLRIHPAVVALGTFDGPGTRLAGAVRVDVLVSVSC